MIEFNSYFSSSKGNLHACSDGTTSIFIDFGVSFEQVQKAVNFKISEYSGALISHSHKDHCKGVEKALKNGLDCYLLPETIKEIGVSGHRVHKMIFHEVFEIGSLKILPFPLQHDVVNSGFLIMSKKGGTIVYITDSYYCKFKFKNVNIFAVECNYSKANLEKNVENGSIHPSHKNRILESHFELENVKEFFRANDLSRVEQIHLIHISSGNGDPELFKSEIQKITGKPVYIKEAS